VNEDYYIVFYFSEDGDTRIRRLAPEALTERLDEAYWGEDVTILEHLPEYGDPNYWPAPALLILPGTIVVPKPVQTVTQWSLS
jgi:hypothetical protein